MYNLLLSVKEQKQEASQMYVNKGDSYCSNILGNAAVTHSVSVCLFIQSHTFSVSLSITHAIQMHRLALKTRILETEESGNFFHNLPQTSSNLSFSLQWSNGDVCSSLVQLNFKKLYTHTEYHYCKHNYHKLSLPSVAPLSLCMILLTYSTADINSVMMQKEERQRKGREGKGSAKIVSFENW